MNSDDRSSLMSKVEHHVADLEDINSEILSISRTMLLLIRDNRTKIKSLKASLRMQDKIFKAQLREETKQRNKSCQKKM